MPSVKSSWPGGMLLSTVIVIAVPIVALPILLAILALLGRPPAERSRRSPSISVC
jgi:hypothetical protein